MQLKNGCITGIDEICVLQAEARLAAKRQARAEAREIRMRELERQQREAEETSDKVYDMYSTPGKFFDIYFQAPVHVVGYSILC